MADYIDRQELQDMLQNRICGIDDDTHILLVERGGIWVNALDELPVADVQKVVHGRWIKNAPNRKQLQKIKDMGFAKGMGVDSIFYTCSNCNMWGAPYMQYCSHCGAKMIEVSE